MKNSYCINFISSSLGTLTTWEHDNKNEIIKEWKRLIEMSAEEIEEEGGYNPDVHLDRIIMLNSKNIVMGIFSYNNYYKKYDIPLNKEIN